MNSSAKRHLGSEAKFDHESLVFSSCSGVVRWRRGGGGSGGILKFKVQGTAKSCILGRFLIDELYVYFTLCAWEPPLAGSPWQIY